MFCGKLYIFEWMFYDQAFPVCAARMNYCNNTGKRFRAGGYQNGCRPMKKMKQIVAESVFQYEERTSLCQSDQAKD